MSKKGLRVKEGPERLFFKSVRVRKVEETDNEIRNEEEMT